MQGRQETLLRERRNETLHKEGDRLIAGLPYQRVGVGVVDYDLKAQCRGIRTPDEGKDLVRCWRAERCPIARGVNVGAQVLGTAELR